MEGQNSFAPACWSTARPANLTEAEAAAALAVAIEDNTMRPGEEGEWRTSGTGMMAFYLSDLQRFGGVLPLSRRTRCAQTLNIVLTFAAS